MTIKQTIGQVLVTVILGVACIPVSATAIGQASLSISPASGVYEVGSTVDVSFFVNTGGEAINAVQADILFPADKLQVVNPAASTSFISIWAVAPQYSNTNGTITLQGGLPSPGIKTSAGVISTVTFRVKAPGSATIRYASTSRVLRNDPDGTNIIGASTPAQLTLKVPPPDGPVVSSPTHPDATLWYNNASVQFTWEPVDQAVSYSYLFDQSPKTVPDETADSTGFATAVKAESDGQWYFHIRAKTNLWGGVTTFPVRIDTTAPAAFQPTVAEKTLTVEEQNVVQFITTDAASGIDHYEIKFASRSDSASGTLFVEASSPFSVPPQEAGEYVVVVRVIDRAGNVADGETTFTVVASGLPFYARVPFLRNPAVANAALIGLAILLLVTIIILLLRRLRIRETFRHDLKMLEHDAQKKSAALQQELSELRQAQEMFQQQYPPAPTPPATTPPPV